MLLVRGGVSAAFAGRDDAQPVARKEESTAAEAVVADDDDGTNGDTRLSRNSPSADNASVTDNDGTDNDGTDSDGAGGPFSCPGYQPSVPGSPLNGPTMSSVTHPP